MIMIIKINKSLLLFIVGFMSYITIEVLFRGYSYPLMGACGGIAVILLDKINDKISWNVDIMLQGLCGSFLITFFELIIGELALHTTLVPQMWNYSNMPLNFDGVICLPFSIVWFFLAIVAIFVADAINYYVFEELPVPYYKLCGKRVLQFPAKHCKL